MNTKKLKDKYINIERCFVLGNSESINKQDLTLLKNEYVITVSNFHLHPQINIIKPTFHVLPPTFKNHKHLHKEEFFINAWMDMGDMLPRETILFMDISDKEYVEKYSCFQDRTIYWTNCCHSQFENIENYDLFNMPAIRSVSESALYIALTLGFKNIFITGIEHSTAKEYKYFSKNTYIEEGLENFLKRIKQDNEKEMWGVGLILSKYKLLYKLKRNIFNANYNKFTRVDTFPQVTYENLFNPSLYKKEIENATRSFIEIPPLMINRSSQVVIDSSKKNTFLKNMKSMLIEISKHNSLNKKYLIHGAGTFGMMINGLLSDNVIGFIDINSSLIGKTISGKKIYSVEDVKLLDFDKIIISTLEDESSSISYLVTHDINIKKILCLSSLLKI